MMLLSVLETLIEKISAFEYVEVVFHLFCSVTYLLFILFVINKVDKIIAGKRKEDEFQYTRTLNSSDTSDANDTSGKSCSSSILSIIIKVGIFIVAINFFLNHLDSIRAILYYKVSANGICYDLPKTGKKYATVTGITEGTFEISIPEFVNYKGEKYPVTRIGVEAFFTCYDLKSITIGDSVKGIGKHAFCYCSGLTSIRVKEGNPVYDSRDNCNAIIAKQSGRLIAGCKNTVIPEDVSSIGEYAFSGRGGLTSITIPESVRHIDGSAFNLCYNLTKIVIPNRVYGIDDHAFYRCGNLTTVVIPDSVMGIGYKAFFECDRLTDVYCYATKPPRSVTSRDNNEYPFDKSHIEEYTTLHVPASSIKAYKAQRPWSMFKNIVAIVDSDSFVKKTPKVIPTNAPKTQQTTDFTIEKGGIFYHISGNTAKVTFCPESISKNSTAYSNDVIIPESIIYRDRTYKVTCIGYGAFSGCRGLTSVVIPRSVKKIEFDAFADCTNLTSITIPDSVSSIGWLAFRGCSSLKSITIPENVKSIGYGVFSGCIRLVSIKVKSGNPVYDSRNGCNAIIETETNTLVAGCMSTVIPNSVTKIGDWAFANCIGLMFIVIPKSLTLIDKNAFIGCINFKDILCYADVPPTVKFMCDFDYSTFTLHVPATSVKTYKETAPWRRFKKIEPIKQKNL